MPETQLTQAQVLAYNKKVTAAKEKASQDIARKDLSEKELARTCDELTTMLGRKITPENLEEEYANFVADAKKTMDSGNKILDGLEKEQKDAVTTAVPVQAVTPQAPEVTEKKVTDDLDALLGI